MIVFSMKPAIGYEFLNGKFSFLAVWMSGLNRPRSSEPFVRIQPRVINITEKLLKPF